MLCRYLCKRPLHQNVQEIGNHLQGAAVKKTDPPTLTAVSRKPIVRPKPQTRRLVSLTAALLALLLIAAACGGDDSSTATAPAAGDSSGETADTGSDLPEQFFTAPTVGGGQIDLGDLQGQDVVLWFWAPW